MGFGCRAQQARRRAASLPPRQHVCLGQGQAGSLAGAALHVLLYYNQDALRLCPFCDCACAGAQAQRPRPAHACAFVQPCLCRDFHALLAGDTCR